MRMGPKDMVMVTGYDEIKHILLTSASEYVDRPMDKFFFEFAHGNGKAQLCAKLLVQL